MNYLYPIMMAAMLALSALAVPQAHAETLIKPTDPRDTKGYAICMKVAKQAQIDQGREYDLRVTTAYCMGWVMGVKNATQDVH